MSAATTPTVTGVSPYQGSLAGGQTITISGSGFTGATTVNFGKAGATNLQVISDNTITATSPNSGTPGPVNVTVVVQGNTSATNSADRFSYMLPKSNHSAPVPDRSPATKRSRSPENISTARRR